MNRDRTLLRKKCHLPLGNPWKLGQTTVCYWDVAAEEPEISEFCVFTLTTQLSIREFLPAVL